MSVVTTNTAGFVPGACGWLGSVTVTVNVTSCSCAFTPFTGLVAPVSFTETLYVVCRLLCGCGVCACGAGWFIWPIALVMAWRIWANVTVQYVFFAVSTCVIDCASRSQISVESERTSAFWLPCTMVVVVVAANALPIILAVKGFEVI